MPKPAIVIGSKHFSTVLYEGNGTGQRVGNFVPFTDNGTIAKSLIFNDGDEPELSRTPSGAGNRDTFTLSFWIKRCTIGSLQLIYQQGADVNNCTQFSFDSSNRLQYQQVDGGGNTDSLISNRTFEDTSKFYHIVLAVDTTQSTEANRVRMYVDGDEITSWNTANYPSQNTDTDMNTTTEFSIGRQLGATSAYSPDCYLAEVNYVDGTQYTPSTFGLTDTSTGRWIPKSLTGISYGTNGFRMQFANSAGQTIGDDTSGNTNDFTVSNLVASDQTTDSPTQNHATLNANPDTGGTLSEGNLKLVTNNTGYNVKHATLKPKTGKWYMEVTVNAAGYGIVGVQGVATMPVSSSSYFPTTYGFGWYQNNGNIYDGGNNIVTSGSTYTTDDVLGIALDLDNQEVKFYKNNSLDNTIGLNGTHVAFTIADFANSYNAQLTANFGQKSFTHTPPTGFVALQQDNLPTTNEDISDLVWIKSRDTASAHMWFDSTRGRRLRIKSDSTSAETDSAGTLERFLKGGFSVGDQTAVNKVNDSTVAWMWHANGGTTVANTDGSGASIASTTQANQTGGFSIVQYTGSGSNGTVAHGLTQAPEWMLIKNTSHTNSWITSHVGLTSQATYSLTFNNTNAEYSDAGTYFWNNAAPTNKVFSLATDTSVNGSSRTYIAYCWHSVEGYSKFGSYSGTGNSDGPFIYTGFKPAFLIIKCSSNASTGWEVRDNKRSSSGGNNTITQVLYPYLTQTELATDNCDFLSNGFKWRSTSDNRNSNGYTYIYMAFAEHPFIGDGTNPCPAR